MARWCNFVSPAYSILGAKEITGDIGASCTSCGLGKYRYWVMLRPFRMKDTRDTTRKRATSLIHDKLQTQKRPARAETGTSTGSDLPRLRRMSCCCRSSPLMYLFIYLFLDCDCVKKVDADSPHELTNTIRV